MLNTITLTPCLFFSPDMKESGKAASRVLGMSVYRSYFQNGNLIPQTIKLLIENLKFFLQADNMMTLQFLQIRPCLCTLYI